MRIIHIIQGYLNYENKLNSEDIGGDGNTETPEIQTPIVKHPRLQGSGDDKNDADHYDDGPPIKMSMNSDSDEVAAGSGNSSDEDVQNGENFDLPEVGN